MFYNLIRWKIPYSLHFTMYLIGLQQTIQHHFMDINIDNHIFIFTLFLFHKIEQYDEFPSPHKQSNKVKNHWEFNAIWDKHIFAKKLLIINQKRFFFNLFQVFKRPGYRNKIKMMIFIKLFKH